MNTIFKILKFFWYVFLVGFVAFIMLLGLGVYDLMTDPSYVQNRQEGIESAKAWNNHEYGN